MCSALKIASNPESEPNMTLESASEPAAEQQAGFKEPAVAEAEQREGQVQSGSPSNTMNRDLPAEVSGFSS